MVFITGMCAFFGMVVSATAIYLPSTWAIFCALIISVFFGSAGVVSGQVMKQFQFDAPKLQGTWETIYYLVSRHRESYAQKTSSYCMHLFQGYVKGSKMLLPEGADNTKVSTNTSQYVSAAEYLGIEETRPNAGKFGGEIALEFQKSVADQRKDGTEPKFLKKLDTSSALQNDGAQ